MIIKKHDIVTEDGTNLNLGLCTSSFLARHFPCLGLFAYGLGGLMENLAAVSVADDIIVLSLIHADTSVSR